jgi:hypothetical protein
MTKEPPSIMIIQEYLKDIDSVRVEFYTEGKPSIFHVIAQKDKHTFTKIVQETFEKLVPDIPWREVGFNILQKGKFTDCVVCK